VFEGKEDEGQCKYMQNHEGRVKERVCILLPFGAGEYRES
jgi:hypothetical protein